MKQVKYKNSLEELPEYRSWKAMIQRCTYKRHISYQRYGKKGITVCEQWRKFKTFLNDMGPKPTTEHQIYRIDNSGNYEPSNCRWVTRHTNQMNRPQPVGVLNGRAKLTEPLIAKAKVLRSYGMKWKDIAKIVGVATSTINNACVGNRWIHLR